VYFDVQGQGVSEVVS